jgi:hypothetical protein
MSAVQSVFWLRLSKVGEIYFVSSTAYGPKQRGGIG